MAYHADSSDLDTKEILTWEGLGSASRELAQDIANAGFEPDVIIAVARGGLCLAGALTYALGVKLSDAINVEFYTDVNQTLPDPVLLAPMLDTESIAFHRRLGFEETGRLPKVGRKFGRWLDAVFMTRVFDGPDPD